ncbi:unnamed protein product [Prunus armeniaca]
MEPITSNEYGFSPSPSTTSSIHCFRIHPFAPSTQGLDNGVAFNRCLQPSLTFAFNRRCPSPSTVSQSLAVSLSYGF